VKYYVRIGAQTLEVEVDGGRVLIDGVANDAHMAAVPGAPLYHLLLGGESWTVAAQALEEPGRWALGVGGERVEVEVVDERTRQIKALAGRRGTGPVAGTIRAPMPGLVVRVDVQAGQRVDAGAGLVVVEAMKMENQLRAPQAGLVAAVHVTAGQTVEKGAALVTLENVEPSG
jgi:biotin carboxyl carrier protein